MISAYYNINLVFAQKAGFSKALLPYSTRQWYYHPSYGRQACNK